MTCSFTHSSRLPLEAPLSFPFPVFPVVFLGLTMLTLTRLALVAAILPFVTATGCGKNQFLYKNKDICISIGGNASDDAGTPPAGVSCPGSKGNWYWSKSTFRMG